MQVPQITCLFHNSVTVSALLNTPAGRPLAGDLLIECASAPALGLMLNLETPANYPGVAGLLGGGDLAALAHPSENLPVPVVLAPGTNIAITAVRSGLAMLGRADDRLKAITWLVPMNEARALGATLALCDRFAIAWDVASFPHEEMLDFGRWLVAEHLIDRTNFAGVHAYASTPPDSAHVRRIAQLLASLGVNGAPGEITVTAA